MSLEVTHLVVNGCSLTYCQGIDKPFENGWPALLGKKLGLPVVNLAVQGSGNDSIHRRTYEYFYKCKKLQGKPFYITAFSHATRREEFFKSYKGKEIEDYHGLDLQASSVDLTATLGLKALPEHFEVAHIMNLSYEACERKKYVLWNSLINLFKATNTPYIVADYMPTFVDEVVEYMIQNYPEIYYNAINDTNNIGEIPKHTKHFKKLSCGHEPQEAMELICNLFYNKITKIYGEIIPVINQEKTYYTLKEYYPPKTQRLLHYNEWITNS